MQPDMERGNPDDPVVGEFRRKRRMQLIGGLATLVVIAAAVVLYLRHQLPPERSRDQLMDRIQRCRMNVIETTYAAGGVHVGTYELTTACRKAIGKLIRRLPGDCPRVLARIKKLDSRDPANRLLNALLRYRRARYSNALTVAEFQRDRCIEEAVLHIHQRHHARGKGPSGLITGLTDYNERFLRRGPNLVILAYLLGRLKGPSDDRVAKLVFARFRKQASTRRTDILKTLLRLYEKQIKAHYLKRHPPSKPSP